MPKFALSALFLLIAASLVGAATQPPAGETTPKPEWVQTSDENAKVLLDVFARFNPEFAGQMGVDGIDEQIIDLKPELNARSNRAVQEAISVLEARQKTEQDPHVKQDLEILIQTARDSIRGTELNQKYLLPYFNAPQVVFLGMRALLDDQVPAERRKAALVRLNRYAGLETGYKPVMELAQDRMRERFEVKGLLGPSKVEVEKDLANNSFFVAGIEQLCKKYSIEGYEKPYGTLKEQISAYEAFVRKEILPRTRTDFRLPGDLYQFSLEQVGIDIPAEQLISEAEKAFRNIQSEMQQVAQKVAKEKGFASTDYRDVIRELKKQQLVGDAILPHYQNRIKDLEKIIDRENMLTLPEREMRIRVASEAESANTPAPNMRPPRLLGNTGEIGEFVLPLNIPAAPGSKEAMVQFDDFTFDAASWTLTAHEGRPGHELQFAAMIEAGVSTARAIFAFNSVNVEGWALYAESLMQPFEPVEGQLIALQHRLMRSARAFLDPRLQLGKMQPEEAKKILMQDVVLSDAMATQEVERYTFRAPGQAPSYFYGYTRLLQLRKDVQSAMGERFDQQKYHDFLLHQGLLPPELLRKTVMEEFVNPKTAARDGGAL